MTDEFFQDCKIIKNASTNKLLLFSNDKFYIVIDRIYEEDYNVVYINTGSR